MYIVIEELDTPNTGTKCSYLFRHQLCPDKRAFTTE